MKTNRVSLLSIVLFNLFIFNVCHGCSKDPDEDRTVPQIIESRGFKQETHYVTTDDGYILAIHRIVNPSKKNSNLRPVILQHGVLSSGADFVMGSPGVGIDPKSNETVPNNLGFALSLIGYDVWLPNSRGNEYSTNHTKFNPKTDKAFWNFTFDEMIKYDLPAVISYVQKVTNTSKIAYVGHSQGTLIMFGLLSEYPKFSNIIEPFIALAPVARVADIESPIRYLAHNPLLVDYFYYKGGPFLPSHDLIDVLIERVCAHAVIRKVCANLLFLITGYDTRNLNETRLPVYMAHEPAGTSAWNILHYGQGVVSKQFRKFDYGSKENERKYGTKTPPVYNLKAITSKHIAILHSQNDWLADPKDVQFLKTQIKDNLMFDEEIPVEKWNHLDFVWALKAGKYVNSIVLQLLKKYK